MDESAFVDVVLNDELKVEENASGKPLLEVSVSFGRFENDLLSWEKWSTFSPNKYLEEVEKYATPGSVAQKRAYFEAHYKKIADRKTKLMEQEKEMEGNATVASDEVNYGGDLVSNGERVDSESETSYQQVSAEVEQNSTLIGEVSSVCRDEVKDDVESTAECESTPDGEKEEPDGRLDCVGSETSKQEEVVVKEVETLPVECQSNKEPPRKLVNKISPVSKVKQQLLKQNRPKESKKTTPVVKERNSAIVKKKPVSSTAKAPQISTPKLSKTTPGPTTPAARSPMPRSSTNKGSNSSLSRSRNLPSGLGEVKKVAPKSLHMSLSLGTTDSDPSSATGIRRSFIMEKMGDKDIVKRAFKTFQNSFNQMKSSPQEEKSSAPKVPDKEKETTISRTVAAKKENGGLHKVSSTIRGTESRTTRATPSQKLEGKSNAKVAGRTNLQSKSKVAPSQKLEEKFNAREGGRTNLLSKSKDASKNGLRS